MDTHQERTVKIEDTIAMLQKTFECPICLDLMKNAVSTKCDHKFCRLCIQKAIGHKSSIPCPICKDPTTKRSLQKLTHWNKIMDKVRELPSAFEADSGIQYSPPAACLMPVDVTSPVKPRKTQKTLKRKSEELEVVVEDTVITTEHKTNVNIKPPLGEKRTKKSRKISKKKSEKENDGLRPNIIDVTPKTQVKNWLKKIPNSFSPVAVTPVATMNVDTDDSNLLSVSQVEGSMEEEIELKEKRVKSGGEGDDPFDFKVSQNSPKVKAKEIKMFESPKAENKTGGLLRRKRRTMKAVVEPVNSTQVNSLVEKISDAESHELMLSQQFRETEHEEKSNPADEVFGKTFARTRVAARKNLITKRVESKRKDANEWESNQQMKRDLMPKGKKLRIKPMSASKVAKICPKRIEDDDDDTSDCSIEDESMIPSRVIDDSVLPAKVESQTLDKCVKDDSVKDGGDSVIGTEEIKDTDPLDEIVSCTSQKSVELIDDSIKLAEQTGVDQKSAEDVTVKKCQNDSSKSTKDPSPVRSLIPESVLNDRSPYVAHAKSKLPQRKTFCLKRHSPIEPSQSLDIDYLICETTDLGKTVMKETSRDDDDEKSSRHDDDDSKKGFLADDEPASAASTIGIIEGPPSDHSDSDSLPDLSVLTNPNANMTLTFDLDLRSQPSARTTQESESILKRSKDPKLSTFSAKKDQNNCRGDKTDKVLLVQDKEAVTSGSETDEELMKLTAKSRKKRRRIRKPAVSSDSSEEEEGCNVVEPHSDMTSSSHSDAISSQQQENLLSEINRIRDEISRLEVLLLDTDEENTCDIFQKIEKLNETMKRNAAKLAEQKENESDEDIFDDELISLKTPVSLPSQRSLPQLQGSLPGTRPFTPKPSDSPASVEVKDEGLPPRPQWSFVASSIDRAKHKPKVEEFSRLLHCPFTAKFNSKTTHVIVKPSEDNPLHCQRTLKYFQGIASQVWVVSVQWVLDCLQRETLLPECDYEICGDTIEEKDHYGPRNSRQSSAPLLHNFYISFVGSFQDVSKDELRGLVERSGGEVLPHPASLKNLKGQNRAILIEGATRSSDAFNSDLYRIGVPIVLKEWLLDSVGTFKVKHFEKYSL